MQTLLEKPVHITGSGSAMFAIYNTANQAKKALDLLPEKIAPYCVAIEKNLW